VQVQTAITRMTTVIVITKTESLTLILDRIEAYISLPDNAPLLSILRFETPQRYCVVQRTQVRLVIFNLTFPWLCANVVFCLRNGGGLPGPHSAASSNSGSSIRPFPDLDVSYPTYPDCLRPVEGQGGRVFSRRKSIPVCRMGWGTPFGRGAGARAGTYIGATGDLDLRTVSRAARRGDS